jgi:hypothetical protein
MEQDFVALLLADAGISALVGTKINWGIAEQGDSPPYIVLNIVSDPPDYTFEGQDDLKTTRVQIDSRALTYLAMWSLKEAVRTKLSGFKGTQGSTQFQGIFIDADTDEYEFDETPNKLFRRRIDVMILSRGV